MKSFQAVDPRCPITILSHVLVSYLVFGRVYNQMVNMERNNSNKDEFIDPKKFDLHNIMMTQSKMINYYTDFSS